VDFPKVKDETCIIWQNHVLLLSGLFLVVEVILTCFVSEILKVESSSNFNLVLGSELNNNNSVLARFSKRSGIAKIPTSQIPLRSSSVGDLIPN
jgi:hypothetical protein